MKEIKIIVQIILLVLFGQLSAQENNKTNKEGIAVQIGVGSSTNATGAQSQYCKEFHK